MMDRRTFLKSVVAAAIAASPAKALLKEKHWDIYSPPVGHIVRVDLGVNFVLPNRRTTGFLVNLA
jgi:hypothetical protein